jgi:glutathione gamma-glutamylcysteinyltransferase
MPDSSEKPQFYQRPLPKLCIPFDGDEGQRIFAEALAEGGMRRFFALVAQFRTQDEPAYCGLATLTMALNTLQIDPGRVWKGVWRWYDESLLDCCKDLELVQTEGITLDEFVCLSRCNGCNASMVRADKARSTEQLEDFRRCVVETCGGTEAVLACSYNRKTLGQTGSGHFSPIGGFNKERDLVLLLDVARFKYPPHWVPLSLCYEAMTAVDPATGSARGWVRLSVVSPEAASEATDGKVASDPQICSCSHGDEETSNTVLDRLTAGQAPSLSGVQQQQQQETLWLAAGVAAVAAVAVCAGLLLSGRKQSSSALSLLAAMQAL